MSRTPKAYKTRPHRYAKRCGRVLAQEPAGFEGGFGPKGHGNSAQALAWVALFLRASPVRAPDNAGAIHIDHTQIQMTISSAPQTSEGSQSLETVSPCYHF
jgi:hypothetical protein